MAKIKYGVEITLTDADLRDYLASLGGFTKEDLRRALLLTVNSQVGADIAKYSVEDMQVKPFVEIDEDETPALIQC